MSEGENFTVIKQLLILGIFFLAAGTSLAEDKPKDKLNRLGGQKLEEAELPYATQNYVHRWIKFPFFKGKSINGGTINVTPQKGFNIVVFFVASWSVGSQDLIDYFKKIEAHYSNLNTRFVYIFVHDTLKDAQGFAKEHGIEEAMLADHTILKKFHNPPPPAIYVADNRGWITTRFLDAKKDDTRSLNYFLKYMTAL